MSIIVFDMEKKKYIFMTEKIFLPQRPEAVLIHLDDTTGGGAQIKYLTSLI